MTARARTMKLNLIMLRALATFMTFQHESLALDLSAKRTLTRVCETMQLSSGSVYSPLFAIVSLFYFRFCELEF